MVTWVVFSSRSQVVLSVVHTGACTQWGRHSHSWVIQFPTWPIEWQQMTALLAWQDYMATGTTDMFDSYEQKLYNNTQIAEVDHTGLIFSKQGRHIIGWGECCPSFSVSRRGR